MAAELNAKAAEMEEQDQPGGAAQAAFRRARFEPDFTPRTAIADNRRSRPLTLPHIPAADRNRTYPCGSPSSSPD